MVTVWHTERCRPVALGGIERGGSHKEGVHCLGDGEPDAQPALQVIDDISHSGDGLLSPTTYAHCMGSGLGRFWFLVSPVILPSLILFTIDIMFYESILMR